MVQITRIRRERIVDAVYHAIRQAILDQVFQPGERLDVESLAEKFDVSLTPVRQAVQMLSTQGLLEVRPRSGTFVAQLTPRDVSETFDLRRALECLAAETAVVNVTEPVLDRLLELLREMRAPVQTGKERQFHEERNTEFHRRLVELSGNRRLIEMYKDLNAHLKIARIHLGSQDWPRRTDQEQKEHQEVFEALRAHDAGRLSDALARHINRAKKALIDDLSRGRVTEAE